MYDDDLFNMISNSYTATDTEQQTFDDMAKTATSQTFQPYQQQSPYIDDYSTNQNFEEETSYDYGRTIDDNSYEQEQVRQVRQMHTPTVMQQAPAVKLTKNREKLYLSPRLKTAAVFFAVIFVAILFASIWNFAQAGMLNASFSGKQAQINEISQSINQLTVEYNELSDPDINIDNAINSGYVNKVDGVNSYTLSLDDFYVEPEIEKLPSNWFNDVCEFFSQLFA